MYICLIVLVILKIYIERVSSAECSWWETAKKLFSWSVRVFFMFVFLLFFSFMCISVDDYGYRKKEYETLKPMAARLMELKTSISVSKLLLKETRDKSISSKLKVDIPEMLKKYNELSNEYNLKIQRKGVFDEGESINEEKGKPLPESF